MSPVLRSMFFHNFDKKDDQPWFVLKDVCDVLELRAPEVKQRLSDDVVSTRTVADSLGRNQETTIINVL